MFLRSKFQEMILRRRSRSMNSSAGARPRRRRASSSGREATSPAPADPWEMEPSSEDYTCVISRGPNPRTVHIFGDRVVEAGAVAETSPRPINLPARGDRGFFSL